MPNKPPKQIKFKGHVYRLAAVPPSRSRDLSVHVMPGDPEDEYYAWETKVRELEQQGDLEGAELARERAQTAWERYVDWKNSSRSVSGKAHKRADSTKLFFGFALADGMFGGDCTISRKKLTPEQAVERIEQAKQAGNLVPVLNPSHQSTISAMRSRYNIDVEIPATAPKAQLKQGDQLVVMGVRGLPRLDATRHEYTDDEIAKATFEFSLYRVESCEL